VLLDSTTPSLASARNFMHGLSLRTEFRRWRDHNRRMLGAVRLVSKASLACRYLADRMHSWLTDLAPS